VSGEGEEGDIEGTGCQKRVYRQKDV
jgi:hypothetical protein